MRFKCDKFLKIRVSNLLSKNKLGTNTSIFPTQSMSQFFTSPRKSSLSLSLVYPSPLSPTTAISTIQSFPSLPSGNSNFSLSIHKAVNLYIMGLLSFFFHFLFTCVYQSDLSDAHNVY